MTRRFLAALVAVFLSLNLCHAKALFPDSETAKNEVELGVEGIARLCPTGLWDHWVFRDIAYDRATNTVVLVIQLNKWKEPRDGKELTETEAREQTEWIVENIMKGYNELKQSPRIMCDGDFMLYLSLGTLLKQMEKDGSNLRIMWLKPDYTNQVMGNLPLSLTPADLKPLVDAN